jgi:ferredoxin-nitrate reductase
MSNSTSYKTTCCYCGVGCGIVVNKDRNGKLHVEGDKDHPVNKGMLCSKGMNLHYTVMDQCDRLLYPEMRYNKNMQRQRVSWDVALERTAAVFKTLIEKYGPDSVAFYASGQCLTEEYYVVNKLIKGFIGSNNIDTNSRLCMSSAVAAYKMSLGEDSVPACYDDIEEADCIFVAGANPAWCHPIHLEKSRSSKSKESKFKNHCKRSAQNANMCLCKCAFANKTGTDIVLHHAIGRVLDREW